jgi:hypothetical protein
MNNFNRFCPIIYVRGYAMTRGEIDNTTADPFCGFNIGSTVQRATSDASTPPKKFMFESPVVRLRSDYGYEDIYNNGVDVVDPDWEGRIPLRSIVIYRYYDSASTLLGDGVTPEIETFATGLSNLILKVRDRVCTDPGNEITASQFRCYLVAHSMGGLVCRAFLQNPKYGTDEARATVDKFFTYATPHNGIDLGGVNVPGWLGANDINNFNREHMAKYLNIEALYRDTKRVDWIPEQAFSSRRIFCMVGTNRGDYDAGAGLSRMFAGQGSDGLVRIANASVWGVDGQGEISAPCATAYTYRSHSGHFGIVNSEEAYQSLARFLFGDVRVDIWADIDDLRVPEELQQADDVGKVNALYQFEVLAGPRGKRWYLTRRVAEEDSVACRTHAELRSKNGRTIYLSSVFLSNKYRVDPKSDTLAYSLRFGVRAPDYEVERRFWPDRHYEGQYLFNDAVVVELKPPPASGGDWKVVYDWQSDNVGQAETTIEPQKLNGGHVEITIPFCTNDATPPISPGIKGSLRFVISQWNA